MIRVIQRQQQQQRNKKSRGCEKSRANEINVFVVAVIIRLKKQKSIRSRSEKIPLEINDLCDQMTHERLSFSIVFVYTTQ